MDQMASSAAAGPFDLPDSFPTHDSREPLGAGKRSRRDRFS